MESKFQPRGSLTAPGALDVNYTVIRASFPGTPKSYSSPFGASLMTANKVDSTSSALAQTRLTAGSEAGICKIAEAYNCCTLSQFWMVHLHQAVKLESQLFYQMPGAWSH